MMIRSFNPEFSEEEYYDEQEKNVLKYNRNIYIHDIIPSPFTSEGATNSYGTVTQVNKVLVRGLPYNDCNSSFEFNKDINDRITFVKSMYIYKASFNTNIDQDERGFDNVILEPIFAIVTGLTNTMVEINDRLSESARYLTNIYRFSDNTLASIYDTTNFNMNKGNLGIRLFQLDIPDPRYNFMSIVNSANRYNKFNNCYTIPRRFVGSDLIRGNTKIHKYINNNVRHDSIKDISKRYNDEKGMLISSSAVSEIINRQILVRNLIVDMVKAGVKSMFEEFTMIYDTKLGTNVKSIKIPCDGFGKEYFEEYFVALTLEFTKSCEKITERYGEVYIRLFVNDIEHIAACTFIEDKLNGLPYNTITVRMNKQECIREFLFETSFTNEEMNRFSELHDIDKLVYYDKNIDNGRMRVTIN